MMRFPNCHTHITSQPETEILNVGTKMSSVVYHSIGIHPWDAGTYDPIQFVNQVEANMTEKCLAIGEIGLDKLQGSTIEVQLKTFIPQVELAKKMDLPVLIHCVRTWDEIRKLHQQIKPNEPWIYHGFAKATIVDEVIDAGFMISLGSNIMVHPKAQFMLDAIPDDKLLLETDDKEIPIEEIASHVANLKNLSLQEMNHLLRTNFSNTFRRWQTGLSAQN